MTNVQTWFCWLYFSDRLEYKTAAEIGLRNTNTVQGSQNSHAIHRRVTDF